MKNVFISLLLLLFATSIHAGNKDYKKRMGELLTQMQTCQTPADFQNLANQFERVAQAERKEWLPAYYQAYCLVTKTFVDREGSASDKDAVLDRAEKVIGEIMEKHEKEAELHVLHAFYLTARLSVDPATRGQQYSMLSQQAIGRALGIDPSHPRARYMKLANDIGTARFFKQDTQKYCGQAQALLDSWDEFKPKSELHPNWGADQVEGIIASCSKLQPEPQD